MRDKKKIKAREKGRRLEKAGSCQNMRRALYAQVSSRVLIKTLLTRVQFWVQ